MNYTNNKRILTHSALVLAMLGALAGCGSDNDDTTVPQQPNHRSCLLLLA